MEISITDVTLRDGLQMVSKSIRTDQKRALWDHIVACKFPKIEFTSFSHPKWMPQFSDSQALSKSVCEDVPPDVQTMAFVPNLKGLERFLAHPIDWASVFISVSETFNAKNVNMSVEKNLTMLGELLSAIKAANRKSRVYVSTVFGCPYEGKISVGQVMKVVESIVKLHPDEIAISDTIGVAVPSQVQEIVQQTSQIFSNEQLALHLHNTYGMALACAVKAIELGVKQFDGALGGLGGCPYAKGASGNVASDELLYYLYREGLGKSFPREALESAQKFATQSLGLSLTGHLSEIVSHGGKWYGC